MLSISPTGNTVYVGLGVSGQPPSQPDRWQKSLTAILAFSLGALCFSRAMRATGPLRRGTLVVSLALQAVLLFVPAALVQSGVVPDEATGATVPRILLLPLAMVSFGSAGQIVLSRLLACGEVPTVVLTSTYCDLMVDPHLFTAPLREGVKRNRRVVSVGLLVGGAVVGGFLTKGERSVANVLWVAGGIKVVMAVAWVFWRAERGVRLE